MDIPSGEITESFNKMFITAKVNFVTKDGKYEPDYYHKFKSHGWLVDNKDEYLFPIHSEAAIDEKTFCRSVDQDLQEVPDFLKLL